VAGRKKAARRRVSAFVYFRAVKLGLLFLGDVFRLREQDHFVKEFFV
jgi:hypothetical protein